MVYVSRVNKWFVISNDKGGQGRFTLSADNENVWVYDVLGENIINDIYSYTRELSKQMGLNTKTQIENLDLIPWIQLKMRHDKSLSFNYNTNVLTAIN